MIGSWSGLLSHCCILYTLSLRRGAQRGEGGGGVIPVGWLGSMALTSPSCPAHWATDRSDECRLPLFAERDVVGGARKFGGLGMTFLISYQSQPHTSIYSSKRIHQSSTHSTLRLKLQDHDMSSSKLSISIELRTGGICLSFDPPIDPVCHIGLEWMDRENQETQETKRHCPIDKMSKEKIAKVGRLWWTWPAYAKRSSSSSAIILQLPGFQKIARSLLVMPSA